MSDEKDSGTCLSDYGREMLAEQERRQANRAGRFAVPCPRGVMLNAKKHIPPTETTSDAQAQDVQFVAGCRERLAEQAKPATEYRRWKCGCQAACYETCSLANWDKSFVSSSPAKVGEVWACNCGDCGGQRTVIACTADGTPIEGKADA
jgi:hypothetical protein